MKWLLPLLLATAAHAKVLRDIPYVKHGDPLQKLDIHLPDKKPETPRPVLVAIHGGGWSIGDKTNASFIQPKTSWFLDQGFVVVSINYRLSPAVEHPAHIEDVCAAIAWVEKNIGKRGGDPEKIYLLGHSAGAHLAALAAVDRERQKEAGMKPENLKGVILLDGAGYDVPKQMKDGPAIPRLQEMYRDAFTDDPEVQRDASPALRVSSTPPSFLILHVARRQDSRRQSQLLADALESHGGKTTVTAVAGKSHATINRDLGKPGDPTTVAVAAFLKSTR